MSSILSFLLMFFIGLRFFLVLKDCSYSVVRYTTYKAGLALAIIYAAKGFFAIAP
jgi:hypothetical protein